MASRLVALLTGALLGALALPALASAAVTHRTYFSDPIKTLPYEAHQLPLSLPGDGRHAPDHAGWITAIDADVVRHRSATARALPIQDVMVHHLVLFGAGGPMSCFGRFYARGEEHQRFALPTGYGLRDGGRGWSGVHMLMDHRARPETVYVRVRVTETTTPQTPVEPLFIDTEHCAADPIFDVPGGRAAGSTLVNHDRFTWPQGYSGRIIEAGGHLHGGGEGIRLVDETCGRTLVDSRSYYGMPSNPFYHVHPRLHEASPVRIGIVRSAQGIPVAAGDEMDMRGIYDDHRLHTRVMSILLGYFAPDPSVTGCPPMPADARIVNRPARYRSRPPRYDVGLVHRPTTPWRTLSSVSVTDRGFTPGRVRTRLGTPVTWRFRASEQHSVTVTDGPRGFSSPWSTGGSFTFTPTARGTYQIFCSLHPARMVELLKVR